MQLLTRLQEVYHREGVPSIFHRFRTYGFATLPGVRRLLFTDYCLQRSLARLERLQEREETLEDRLDTIFTFRGVGGYRELQPSFLRDTPADVIRTELRELTGRLEAHDPRYILDIGTANAGMVYLWARQLDSVNQVVGIDNGVTFAHRTDFYETFAPEKDLTFVPGNSHRREIKESVRQAAVGPFDFVFIDGDHTYQGVKDDFEMYRELASDDAIIGFQNIVETPHSNIGVHRFWNELQSKYDTESLIATSDQNWGGIGLVYL